MCTKIDFQGHLMQFLKYRNYSFHLKWYQRHFRVLTMTTFLACIFLLTWYIAANMGLVEGI